MNQISYFIVHLSSTPLANSVHSSQHLTTLASHSLKLFGGVRQAWKGVSQIGRADFWSTLRVGLPCCSEQRARYWAPQLGAGDPFGMRGHSLSDKELEAMVDDPVEDVVPWGWSGHIVQGPPVSSTCPVLRDYSPLFGHRPCTWSVLLGEVLWLNFHIQPQFGPLGFDDVNICLVNGPNAARGRLPIRHDLVRDKHMVCSVVAVRPACLASLANRSLMRSCLLECKPLVQHAACRPKG